MPKAETNQTTSDDDAPNLPDELQQMAFRPFWVHPNVWRPIQQVADQHGIQAQQVFTAVLHEGLTILDDFENYLSQNNLPDPHE